MFWLAIWLFALAWVMGSSYVRYLKSLWRDESEGPHGR